MLALGSACGHRFPSPPPDQRVRALTSPAVSRALPARGLHLLVWNIKKTQRPSWQRDFERLSESADLVLLQEAYDHPPFRAGLASRAELHWQMGISFEYARRDGIATGVATGSIARPRATAVVHAPKREPFVPTPKAAMLQTFAIEGHAQTLLVINLHAINFRRAKHLREHLEAVGDAIAEHEGPVILAGDMNTHHRPRMRVLERFADDHGLHPVFPNWVEGTRRRPVVDGRMRHLRMPLDHVYLRGLEARWARTRPEIAGSDHVPLEVLLRVAPRDPVATTACPARARRCSARPARRRR